MTLIYLGQTNQHSVLYFAMWQNWLVRSVLFPASVSTAKYDSMFISLYINIPSCLWKNAASIIEEPTADMAGGERECRQFPIRHFGDGDGKGAEGSGGRGGGRKQRKNKRCKIEIFDWATFDCRKQKRRSEQEAKNEKNTWKYVPRRRSFIFHNWIYYLLYDI